MEFTSCAPFSVAGLVFYSCLASSSICNCNSCVSVASSSSRHGAPIPQHKHLADPKKWPDNRVDIRRSCARPEFHKEEQQHHRQQLRHHHHHQQQESPTSLQISGLIHEFQTFCTEGHLDMALDVLSHMDHVGTVPTHSMYLSLLQVCSKQKAMNHAKQVGVHLVSHGLDSNTFLIDNLVSTLVKCGGLEDALEVFHLLPHRTVFAWTAVISGYTDCGKGQESLKVYRCMREEGVEPNAYTFVSLFKACGSIPDLDAGKALHADARRKGLDSYVFVGNSLISMYGKCGDILEAETVFRGLPWHDVVSWNAMLSAYIEQCDGEKAVQMYRQMQEEGVKPNDRTFVIALQACCILREKDECVSEEGQPTTMKSLELGQALHADVRRKASDVNIFVHNALISMYGKCGSIMQVLHVFDAMSQLNGVSWTALLSAYVEHGLEEKALQLYQQMQEEGFSPDEWTFVVALQACCKLAEKEEALVMESQFAKVSLKIGQALHADAEKGGFDSGVFVGSTLVKLYGKCGTSMEAEIAFGRLSEPSIVSWNAMLSAYVDRGEEEKALQLFRQMSREGPCPNVETFAIALQTCCALAEEEEAVVVEGQLTKLMSFEFGLALHADAQKKGFDSDVFVGNALINMYGKCGSVLCAHKVFDGLLHRDVVSWTAMLTTYVEQGTVKEALQMYRLMKEEGVTLDEVTLVCLLQACSEMGSVEICRHIHFTAVSAGCYLSLPVVNTLIHAYGSCASMVDAQAVFNRLPGPSVVSWSAMIAGYARAGNYIASMQNFEKMLRANIKPNKVTFQSLISACSHAGLMEKGIEYFKMMSTDYGLTPDIEHYVSMVDLLGRAGDFAKVEDMLSRMSVQPNLEIWLSLLGTCKKHGNVELGKHAFDHAVHLHPKQAAAYVLMSNIYADAGLQDCAIEVDNARQKQGAWKKPGQSWVEHEQELYSFVVGDYRHPQHEQLYDLLQKLSLELEEKGLILHNKYIQTGVPDKAEALSLCGHSEKLAVAFALLYIPIGEPIFIRKNMRMCKDCHNFICLSGEMKDREITVMDEAQVHHFKGGNCSCGDLFHHCSETLMES